MELVPPPIVHYPHPKLVLSLLSWSIHQLLYQIVYGLLGLTQPLECDHMSGYVIVFI